MHDGAILAEAAQLEQRSLKTLLEAIRQGLRQERRLGEDAFRGLIVRVQLAERKRIGALITPLLDEDRKLRDRTKIAAGQVLDGPTPELVARRRGGVIMRMWARGTLRDVHLRAVGEIREAFESCGRTPDMAGSCELVERVDTSLNPARIEGARLVDARIERRFRRWLGGLDEKRREPILAVLVLDTGIRDAERKHDMTNGTLPPLIKGALDAYCRFAAWTENTSPIDGARTNRL